jgi:hypothetical protein
MRAVAVGGGLAAVVIAAAATSWALMRNDPPAGTAFHARTGETPPPSVAEPSLDPMTHTEDKPATPDISVKPEKSVKSSEPGTTKDPEKPTESRGPVAAPGLLVGGIVYSGGPTPGQSAADGYQAGLVEVFTDKGRRVTTQRSDRRGFRFSLPQGGYRLQTSLGKAKCTTIARVKPEQTTRADLKCSNPQPPSSPPFQTAAIKDVRGDVKDRPNAGTAPHYADFLAAATQAGKDGVSIDFHTAGAIPVAAPSKGQSLSH